MRHALAAFVLTAGVTVLPLASSDTTLAGWFDLPVPGGAITLAALEIPDEERALTLPILARAVHDGESRSGLSLNRLSEILASATASSAAVTAAQTSVVPAPLDDETWRALLELKSGDPLFPRLVVDKHALLLAAALMTTDASVRTLVGRDRDLLRFVYREAPAAFAIVARRLRLDVDRIAVPGGPAADPVWTDLVGSPPTRPAAFLRALVARDEGRLAWYFDTVAGMDAERLALAWPPGPPRARRDHARALYQVFRDSDPQWSIPRQPYRRHVADATTVVMHSVLNDGKLVGPSPHISLLDLARSVTTGPVRERRDTLEAFLLAQRVFPHPDPADLADINAALAGFSRFRALLLTLERMEIARPQTWAAMVKAAQHVTDEADDRTQSMIAFQAVVGLIERIRHVRTIDVATADRLLWTLAEAVQRDQRVTASITAWITRSFTQGLPALERPDAWTGRTAYESTILQALAGPRERPVPATQWESLTYIVDVVAAERERLHAVRSHLPSPGLDAALAGDKPRELAAALTALLYTSALGEGDGAVTLSRNIAMRHELGFNGTSLVRDVRPWSPPEERQGMGPWRVQGALLGLDLGLSRLALRRLSDEQMPRAPTLTMNDFGSLTRTVVAMSPFDLTDADRNELAQAIARGRARVTAALGTGGAIDALAAEAGMSAVTRQLIPWLALRQPDSLADIFTLRDLMWLGRPALTRTQLDRWGVSSDGVDARRSTVMPPPRSWEDFAGRSDVGQIATQVPDLTLRLVEETARLRLPAMLIPSLLAFATNDYWHDVQVRFADDWWRMTRQARALESTRVEDYVAALTGNGPLRSQ